MNHDKGQPIGYPPNSDGPQTQCGAFSDLSTTTGTAILAQNVTVRGDLCGTGAVLVDGAFIGKIKLNGTVTVSRTGTVEGPIQAESVCVAGSVTGNITAKKYLRLEMTGSITGDVTVSSFTIEDGGYFNGRSHMTKSGEEPVIEYYSSIQDS